MGNTLTGTKGQPVIDTTPSTVTDIQAVANYAALVGNRKVGTTTQRNAAQTAGAPLVWEGLEWEDTTDGHTYKYRSGSFVATDFGNWTTYTPTLTNLTLGTGGSSFCEWRDEGHWAHVRLRFTLGSSGFTVGTLPTATLPVAMSAPFSTNARLDNDATYFDTSATQTFAGDLSCIASSTTAVRFLAWPSSVGLAQPVTATAPFTWAAGDVLSVEFGYRTA